MDKLIIEGGVPLTGVVHVSGSKNAALPILMGSILLDEPVTYTNVPDLRDIRTTFKLLELLGCPNAFENGQVTVTPGALNPEAPYELVKTMRASVLVLGPARRSPRSHARRLRHRSTARRFAPVRP